MLACLYNGCLTNHLTFPNRMVSFGDGLFETCLATSSGVRFLDDHMERLNEGARRLNLAWSASDQQSLDSEIQMALTSVNSAAVLKITLGRQAAGRGYDYDPATQSTNRLIQVFEYSLSNWYGTGARVVTSSVPASINPALAGIKHLNRLDSVLARQTARQQGAHESLLGDGNGWLVEGSMSNLFYRRDGQWQTPDLVNAGVNGIIRRRWLQASANPLSVAAIQHRELAHCDGVLIGNTLIGLVMVTHLDNEPVSPVNDAELAHLRTQIGLDFD